MSWSLISRFTARAPQGAFGPGALGFASRSDGGTVSLREDGKVVDMELPRWAKPTLGVLTAVMDEASSLTMALTDKKGRFGVSILLDASLVNEASSSNVTAWTTVKKLGRAIGIADVEIFGDDGKLLARGRHIKFLQTGNLLADNLKTVLTLPFVDRLVTRYLDRLPVHPPSQATSLDDLFAIDVHNEVPIRSGHCNPFGSLHGGASCLLAEHLATNHLAAEVVERPPPRAVALTATFLSSILTGDTATITAQRRLRDTDVVRRRRHRSRRRRRRLQVVRETRCRRLPPLRD